MTDGLTDVESTGRQWRRQGTAKNAKNAKDGTDKREKAGDKASR
jgi:hypothetical protein